MLGITKMLTTANSAHWGRALVSIHGTCELARRQYYKIAEIGKCFRLNTFYFRVEITDHISMVLIRNHKCIIIVFCTSNPGHRCYPSETKQRSNLGFFFTWEWAVQKVGTVWISTAKNTGWKKLSRCGTYAWVRITFSLMIIRHIYCLKTSQ